LKKILVAVVDVITLGKVIKKGIKDLKGGEK
jgi:hypothetical protein